MNNAPHRWIATVPPVWVTTGCSRGFGLELANQAKQAIERGYRTVITARDPSTLERDGATDNVLVLKFDVTPPEQVAAAVQATHSRFGRGLPCT